MLFHRLLFIGCLPLLSASALGAQTLGSHALRFGVHLPIGRKTEVAALLCDGSAVRSVDQRRTIGKVLWYGSLVTDVVVFAGASNGNASVASLLPISGAASLGGIYLLYTTHLSDDFWNDVLSRAKVGDTRLDDVRTCLGKPIGTTVSANDQTWTYSSVSIGWPFGWFGDASARAVSFQFKNGVLSNVSRNENQFGK